MFRHELVNAHAWRSADQTNGDFCSRSSLTELTASPVIQLFIVFVCDVNRFFRDFDRDISLNERLVIAAADGVDSEDRLSWIAAIEPSAFVLETNLIDAGFGWLLALRDFGEADRVADFWVRVHGWDVLP